MRNDCCSSNFLSSRSNNCVLKLLIFIHFYFYIVCYNNFYTCDININNFFYYDDLYFKFEGGLGGFLVLKYIFWLVLQL